MEVERPKVNPFKRRSDNKWMRSDIKITIWLNILLKHAFGTRNTQTVIHYIINCISCEEYAFFTGYKIPVFKDSKTIYLVKGGEVTRNQIKIDGVLDVPFHIRLKTRERFDFLWSRKVNGNLIPTQTEYGDDNEYKQPPTIVSLKNAKFENFTYRYKSTSKTKDISNNIEDYKDVNLFGSTTLLKIDPIESTKWLVKVLITVFRRITSFIPLDVILENILIGVFWTYNSGTHFREFQMAGAPYFAHVLKTTERKNEKHQKAWRRIRSVFSDQICCRCNTCLIFRSQMQLTPVYYIVTPLLIFDQVEERKRGKKFVKSDYNLRSRTKKNLSIK
jgi:hypothetical protein